MKNIIASFTISQTFALTLLSSAPFVTEANAVILGDVSRNRFDVLEVGRTDTGKLNINNGSAVSSGAGILGVTADSHGTVTVEGAGSSWTNSNGLIVGELGTGTLNIKNGGTVSNNFGFLGKVAGSSGTVTVDGADSSWTNVNGLIVGELGTGTLNIHNGGVVSSEFGFLGITMDSNGTITVDGTGSSWTNNLDLQVGVFGTGTLNIKNGGAVSNNRSHLGVIEDSNGTVTVDGASSSWTSRELIVGDSGTGTLNINNEGLVDVTSFLQIGSTGTINLNGGTINANVFNNGGIVEPGNSLGTLTVDNYTQDINSTLNIELGGVLAGTEYDVLAVTGTANLGGTLNVSFFDLGSGLFDATLGDTFNILLAESINGEFDILTLAVLGEGLDWQLNYLIDFQGTTDIVQLSVVSAVPLPTAVWLFGSGLLGLIGIARHKKL